VLRNNGLLDMASLQPNNSSSSTSRLNRLAIQLERTRASTESGGPLPFPWPLWIPVLISAALHAVVYLYAGAFALVIAGVALPKIANALGPVWLMVVGLIFVFGSLIFILTLHRDSLMPKQRALTWQKSLSSEHHSWKVAPPRYQLARYQFIFSPLDYPRGIILALNLDRLRMFRWTRTPALRWLVRIWGIRPNASADERIAWAHRWALSREIRPLVTNVILLATYFAVFTLLLWHNGIISSHGRLSPGWHQPLPEYTGKVQATSDSLGAAEAAYADYLWQMADLVPVLGIASVLGWQRPTAFAGDPVEDVLIYLFRLLFVVLVVWYITYLIRDNKPVNIEPLQFAGPVERMLVEELVDRGQLLDEESWPAHPSRYSKVARIGKGACRRLAVSGISPPPSYQQWSHEALTVALLREQGQGHGKVMN
jgi:hypothetical protein